MTAKCKKGSEYTCLTDLLWNLFQPHEPIIKKPAGSIWTRSHTCTFTPTQIAHSVPSQLSFSTGSLGPNCYAPNSTTTWHDKFSLYVLMRQDDAMETSVIHVRFVSSSSSKPQARQVKGGAVFPLYSCSSGGPTKKCLIYSLLHKWNHSPEIANLQAHSTSWACMISNFPGQNSLVQQEV